MNYFADYHVYYGNSDSPAWELSHGTEEFLSLQQITEQRLREVLESEYCATEIRIFIYEYSDDKPLFYKNSDLPFAYTVIVQDTELYRPLNLFNGEVN